MISMRQKGNFRRLKSYLTTEFENSEAAAVVQCGEEGKRALAEATPVYTGLTRDSWHYETRKTQNGRRIVWYNTNTTVDGLPIVVLIEYGHGTRGGGYVPGRYFIKPAIRPIIAKFSSKLKPEVK